MRLPTEAEFEFAARAGGMKKYPWGDADPDCARLAFAGCGVNRPPAVGTNPGDVFESTDGKLFDLAGGVPEWVDDSYVPSIGCVDHLTYGELCWGKNAGCAAARCAADAAACGKGCLPSSIDVGSTGNGAQVTNSPACPALGEMAAPQDDPVTRTPSGLAVIRGGSFADGPCALVGYTRRHAEPRRTLAGFRCAKSATSNGPRATTSYRFTITNCVNATTAKITVTTAAKPAAYALDVFPSNAQPMMTMLPDGNGSVSGVPCDAVFVVRPTMAAPELDVTASTDMACAPTSKVDFTGGGDVPAVGIDEVQVGGQCGG